MKPGSAEYKAATRTLLTASDFGAACGLNPYKSRQQLWRLKTGRERFDGNDRTRYGQDNEHRAISAYEVATGALVAPGRFCRSPRPSSLGCTPDGFVGATGLLEAKCPISGLYEDIPVYYLAQVIGQLAITCRSWCDFIAWERDASTIWRVEYNQAAWHWMLPMLESMVNSMQEDKEPERFGKNNPRPDKSEFRSLINTRRI